MSCVFPVNFEHIEHINPFCTDVPVYFNVLTGHRKKRERWHNISYRHK